MTSLHQFSVVVECNIPGHPRFFSEIQGYRVVIHGTLLLTVKVYGGG